MEHARVGTPPWVSCFKQERSEELVLTHKFPFLLQPAPAAQQLNLLLRVVTGILFFFHLHKFFISTWSTL